MCDNASDNTAHSKLSDFLKFLLNVTPGGRFSKVPKLHGLFSGVMIASVSQERRADLSRQTSQPVYFLSSSKHVKRSAFLKKRLAGSQMAFRARNVFGTFEKL